MSDSNRSVPASNVAPHKLMLLITIVQKGKGTFFSDFLKNYDANLQVCVVGKGTAQTNLVEFLGLKDSARTIIFSVVRQDKVQQILEALEERFHTVSNDTGVSFAVPFSSVIGKLSYAFLSDNQRMVNAK